MEKRNSLNDIIKAKYGLVITSYEMSDDTPVPILNHIFWGNNMNQVIGYAKSHLITDYFFSSSFVGKCHGKGHPLDAFLRNDHILF